MGRSYEVWFAIPSASLERCRKVLPRWRERGYKIAILQNQEKGDIPADIVRWSDTYPGWSQSINILSKQIVPASADIVVSGGCDMLPDPDHTAQQLAQQFYERFPDGFGVMQPHGDSFGNARHYCGSPFLGRKWIDTMYRGNGPMQGEYRHNWGDVELYWVSKCMNALWERPDLTHFHEHFNRDGTGKKPQWWINNVERNDRHDVELFLSRKWLRFPGHEPIGEMSHRVLDARPLFEDPFRLAERHHESLYGGRGEREMSDTLVRLSKLGVRSVALYGAGRHTRHLGQALLDPPVQIECIIDDDAERQGTRLWGFPIVSRAEALRRGVQAVVISSDGAEGKLYDNCAEMHEKGIRVVRLYDPSVEEKNTRVRRAFDRCSVAGRTRVALYGAGAHTADLKDCLVNPPIELVCVIDDNARPGTVMHGVPVVTPASAASMRLDAVVLSSNRNETQMWENTEGFRKAGVEVIRLYDRPGSPASARPVAIAV